MLTIKIISALFLGALLWTLTEYVLHRFLGHVKKRLLIRTRFHKEHTKHHLKRDYFAGAQDKLLTLLATAPVIYILSLMISDSWFAAFFTLGFTLMYLSYELIHWRMHVKAPPHLYASKMRAHHFYHHFVDETMNHGVTTPIWDWVFGTYRRPEVITYPKKFKLCWIDSAQSGFYQDPWGQCYQQS
jgi:sterol desaturase/sphingolipid hydroxylase (fatty acid hydroxylase superfamily)